jgi:hypothetical protein
MGCSRSLAAVRRDTTGFPARDRALLLSESFEVYHIEPHWHSDLGTNAAE